MQKDLNKEIFSTLAFFALYELPLTLQRVHELLGQSAAEEDVQQTVAKLVEENKIYQAGGLYSLTPWKASDYRDKQVEISKKWKKIDRYYNWLAVLPFARMVAVINSLSLGTADADSDIDFFIVTKNRRMYFVRSLIIVLFRLLGVYKTRQKIKDRFCFGFFVTQDGLELEHLLIKPHDPYFMYWLASMQPIVGGQQYELLIQANKWLTNSFPNFKPEQRLKNAEDPNVLIKSIKFILEILLIIPVLIVEPMLERIHIKHTFKLAENNTITSTTVANSKMLKLHASDVRASIAARHQELIQDKNREMEGPMLNI